MEEEQCPCDDCDAACDYWDSKNIAVYIVVGSMETLNLTVRIVTRWIFERTVNKL